MESTIFRLNAHLTAVSMIIALFVATTAVFVTRPIYCDGMPGIPSLNYKELVEAHCYLHGTYRYVSWHYVRNGPDAVDYQMSKSKLPTSVRGDLYPGIRVPPNLFKDNNTDSSDLNSKDVYLRYTYFNWLFVTFFLMVSPLKTGHNNI